MITSTVGGKLPSRDLRAWTLKVFGGYVALVACVNLWRLVIGTGSVVLLIAQLIVLAATVFSLRSRTRFWTVTGDWLPLIVLPMLYWELPWATFSGTPMHDSAVQRWDLALFASEPARTLAGTLPWRPLSEVHHLAYILYYAIIYVPPVVLYVSARRPERSVGRNIASQNAAGFYETVFAMTMTVVISFAAFSVFPVEGPRFAWGPPPGVPAGPIRTFTLLILEHGSARGTAFPSSHVAIALAQTFSSLRWRRPLGLGVAITTIFLAIGAVYGGFHYASDVLAGVVVGIATWSVARRMESTLRFAPGKRGERQ